MHKRLNIMEAIKYVLSGAAVRQRETTPLGKLAWPKFPLTFSILAAVFYSAPAAIAELFISSDTDLNNLDILSYLTIVAFVGIVLLNGFMMCAYSIILWGYNIATHSKVSIIGTARKVTYVSTVLQPVILLIPSFLFAELFQNFSLTPIIKTSFYFLLLLVLVIACVYKLAIVFRLIHRETRDNNWLATVAVLANLDVWFGLSSLLFFARAN